MILTTTPMWCPKSGCPGVLKRMPEIYFALRKAFYGCEYCGLIIEYDIIGIDRLENPRIDKRTCAEYTKEFAKHLPAGAI